jgi:hypothetical protein
VKGFRERSGRITLGADPEYELVVGDRIVNAWRFYGCNGRPSTDRRSATDMHTKIGTDGHAETFEMRPDPVKEPIEMLNDLRDLYRQVYSRGHRLAISGNREAIGGHIHFGVGKATYEGGECQGLVQALDDFLGRRLVELSGRARGGYCQLSAQRVQPHGFEYRSLPAAIFAHPRILGIVLQVCRKLADSLNGADFTYEVDGAGKATRESMVELVGERNVALLENFIERYQEMQRANSRIEVQVRAWGLATGALPAARATFCDDWSISNRRAVEETVAKYGGGMQGAVVEMFGLQEGRGNDVVQLPEGMEVKGFRIVQESERAGIGVSYTLRTDPARIPELVRVVQSYMDFVKQQSKKRGNVAELDLQQV